MSLANFTFPASYPQTLGVMQRLPDIALARNDWHCSFCRHPLVPPAYYITVHARKHRYVCLECAEQHERELAQQASISEFLFTTL